MTVAEQPLAELLLDITATAAAVERCYLAIRGPEDAELKRAWLEQLVCYERHLGALQAERSRRGGGA